MLRVGLTGELGSGKSTVARLLAERGAVVLSSDEMARTMMQPGHPVFRAIVDHFGPAVLLPDGQLNRAELAHLAFDPENPRVEELNAIVHPAVLAEQERQVAEISRTQPNAIVVIESALIFTTKHAGNQPWRKRFDCVILVSASEELNIARFVARSSAGRDLEPGELAALQNDARLRLSRQGALRTGRPDIVLENLNGMDELRRKVDDLWASLQALQTSRARNSGSSPS